MCILFGCHFTYIAFKIYRFCYFSGKTDRIDAFVVDALLFSSNSHNDVAYCWDCMKTVQLNLKYEVLVKIQTINIICMWIDRHNDYFAFFLSFFRNLFAAAQNPFADIIHHIAIFGVGLITVINWHQEYIFQSFVYVKHFYTKNMGRKEINLLIRSQKLHTKQLNNHYLFEQMTSRF